MKNRKTGLIKPILITERDKAVMSRTAEYRILTTEQIYRLCFPSLSRARKRLLQLWGHGYLKRIVRPTRIGEGSSIYLYLLTRRGLALLPDNDKPGSGREARHRLSTLFTEHTLRINDFRSCLDLATRGLKDGALLFWRQGKELLMKAIVKDKPSIKIIPIIPDAYFAIKHDGRVFHYFLEIDRGTTDLKRIAMKCRGYLNIWQEKIAQSKFGIRSFRVLYVTTSSRRLSNVLEQLHKLQSSHHRSDIIMITSFDAFSLAQPLRVFEPIWKTLDTDGRAQNVCLLPNISHTSSRRREENHHCAVQNPIPVNGTPGLGG